MTLIIIPHIETNHCRTKLIAPHLIKLNFIVIKVIPRRSRKKHILKLVGPFSVVLDVYLCKGNFRPHSSRVTNHGRYMLYIYFLLHNIIANIDSLHVVFFRKYVVRYSINIHSTLLNITYFSPIVRILSRLKKTFSEENADTTKYDTRQLRPSTVIDLEISIARVYCYISSERLHIGQHLHNSFILN